LTITPTAGSNAHVTHHFPTNDLQFFLTAPTPCPYLNGRRERKVFANLEGLRSPALVDTLTHAGFRRSQSIAYRPACEGCDACVSARVVTGAFAMERRWRRVRNRNRDLTRRLLPAEATEEQFWLLRRYLLDRHGRGGMAEMSMIDYISMVEDTPVRTHLVEYRYSSGPDAGDLAACVLIDLLGDGLSLVYSFYDPRDERRGLGTFVILDHILQAQAANLPFVYLGYWIKNSPKMAYKTQFQPLELLRGGTWRPYKPAEECEKIDNALSGPDAGEGP
jgi:arginine-tRNA-protein transferase